MRTDRFALADLGQQDRLDEIVTDAARGLEDTFDVNERSNTSTGRGRLRKRKIKHAKKVTRFSTAFADPSTADKRRERPKSNCFSVSPENV